LQRFRPTQAQAAVVVETGSPHERLSAVALEQAAEDKWRGASVRAVM
jgi:hypothetical protein